MEVAARAAHSLSTLALLVAGSACAATTDYPNRPLRLVTPVLAGGGADATVRMLAGKLSETFNQRVVVDNRPGASNIIGTDIVAKATPDGYTILWVSSTHAINAGVRKGKLPFDPLNDFAPITLAVDTPLIIVVPAALPAKTLPEFIALAKAKPGGVSYGSAGQGTSGHLANELLSYRAGIKMLHVPFKGSPEAIQETIAGRTAYYMAPLQSVISQIQGGKVRALGITSGTRADAAPNIATIAEQGFAGFEIGRASCRERV